MGGPTGFNRKNDWEAIVETAIFMREEEQKAPFSVIHFNWGLHALKYIHEDGTLATPQVGTQCVPAENYGAELEKLVLALKKTKAKLVFATTTPVQSCVPWLSLIHISVIPDVIIKTDLENNRLLIRPLKGLFDDAD